MNPLNKNGFMTPAMYMMVALLFLIPLCKWKWGDSADWFLYLWFASVFVVAMLWNELYLWKDDER